MRPQKAPNRFGYRATGYVEGPNVAIEYRWAERRSHRLPVLAADLVARNVDVIAASGGPQPASAAFQATAAIRSSRRPLAIS